MAVEAHQMNYLLVQIIHFVFCFEILLDPYRHIDWQMLRDFSMLPLKKIKVNYVWEGFTGGSNDKEHACQSCRRCKRGRFHPWVRMIPWRRKWQLTPVFLPGEFHGQRNLVGYSPWGGKESDTTDGLTLVFPYVSLSLRISLLWNFF